MQIGWVIVTVFIAAGVGFIVCAMLSVGYDDEIRTEAYNEGYVKGWHDNWIWRQGSARVDEKE
jgi:hypothetical protein